jgi:signal transduction histidine kinase
MIDLALFARKGCYQTWGIVFRMPDPLSVWPVVRRAVAGASPAVRRQILWIAVLWTGMLALQIWDSADASGPAGVAEFLSAILGASGGALMGVAWTLQRTMEEEAGRPRPAGGQGAGLEQVLIALPAVGFLAGVALGGAVLLMVFRVQFGVPIPLVFTSAAVFSGMLAMAGVTVTRSSKTLFRFASQQAAAAAAARSDAAVARFSALQARMNPHFLFNALNTIAALVRTDASAAERAVENLSDVLRQTLDRSAETMGTVAEEVEYLRAYLDLERERLGDRLHVDWEIDPAALARPLPPLTLQPLVENALRHGLGGRMGGGRIRVRVSAEPDRVRLRVEDDGEGFPAGWKEGTGLGNLRQRLRALYGEKAELSIDRTVSGGAVTVVVPAT